MYRSKTRRLWTDPLDPETIGNWISRCGESTSDSNQRHFRRERSWRSTVDGKLFFWDSIVLIACFGEVATHPLLSDFDAFAGCGVWRWWRRLVDARKRKVRFIISVSAAAQVQNYPPPVQALNPHIARNCHFQLGIWIRTGRAKNLTFRFWKL